MSDRWLWALIAVLVLVGCVGRTASYDDESTRPACATIPGWGYWENGGQHIIINEVTGTAGTACLCLSDEEMLSRVRHDELNELAFAECTRLADVYSGNFDWDDCEESYLSEVWTSTVAFAAGDDAWRNIEGLDCEGDGEPQACSFSGDPDAVPITLLCALFGLAWLHHRRASELDRS